MSEMQASTTFSEKLRRIRFRRTREKLRFRDELRIIPKWLVWLVAGLFVAAQITLLIVNLGYHLMSEPPGDVFPYAGRPLESALALAGMATVVGFVMGSFLLLTGYVNRDARRRGMNSTLWTILVLFSSGWGALGFIIYFLMREPLPYSCPQCGAQVGAQFNFCPNCKCNLRPACPQCKREVGEMDKFCAYCSCELTPGSVGVGLPPQAGTTPTGILPTV